MTEEEVKARIILPWLYGKGLHAADLDLETTFKLSIGTNDVVIGGASGKRMQRARLDILVRKGQKNLLIIEVKEPNAQLDEDDRDQAISYARLLPEIAPFALVTNGSQFLLYDVVSRDLLPDGSPIDEARSIELPDETRLEALRLFFTLSEANLVAFSRGQVANATERMFGEPSDFSAIYIRETHLERRSLTAAARSFFSSAQPVFALAGESGMGKSSTMIDLAGQLLSEGYAVLFFRGAFLRGDLLDAVMETVEWAFGPTRGRIDTLRQLVESARSRPVVIMVDGVEDWDSAVKVQHLDWLTSQIDARRVRLIVSSKTRSWAHFLSVRGNQTGIRSRTYLPDNERICSAEVGPFSHQEFSKAVQLHREAHGVPEGGFDPVAHREARRSPFLLRLMFQVKAAELKAGQASSGRITLDSAAFFQKYLELAVGKTGNDEATMHTLIGVAAALYEANEEWIEEGPLRSFLGLRVNETFPAGFFETGMVIGVGTPGLRRIGFAFGQLRNYIIAFHVRRWPSSTQNEFAADFASASRGTLRSEVCAFYYSLAPLSQKKVIDAGVRENAERYLSMYVTLIDQFPLLRDRFAPYTHGRIGFVGELRFPATIGLHGFRPISEREDDVLLIPSDGDKNSVRMFVAGAVGVHSYGVTFGFQKPATVEQIRATVIADQLGEMVEKGLLNETATPDLADELIACIIQSQACFAAFVDPKTRRVRYPIAVSEVALALRREFLYQRFRDAAVQAKRQRGEIKETWRGSAVSYSANLLASEEAEVATRVDQAIQSGSAPPPGPFYSDLERIKRRLEQSIDARRQRGDTIAGPALPLLTDIREALQRGAAAPMANLKEHCRRNLELALHNYRGLVESNFPSLLSHFELYQQLPIRAVLVIRAAEADGRIDLARCKSSSGRDEVLVYEHEEATVNFMSDTVTTPFGTESYRSCQVTSLGRFLYGGAYRLEFDGDSGVLRRWVYGWLQDDFRAVSEWLKKLESSNGA